jgi:hypothetical protein
VVEKRLLNNEDFHVNYRGRVKGKTIELDEPLPFPQGQALRVSVEPLTTSRAGTAQAILDAISESPHLRATDVDALEAALQSAKLPVRESFILNDKP